MKRVERILAWFLLGGVFGAILGALGGLMDSGSMMILMPSGSVFWAIIGAFFGCIFGAVYGAFSKLTAQRAHFIKPENTTDAGEAP